MSSRVPPKSPGRPKGTPNKATALAREAIARFVDGNAKNLQKWLDEIAATEGSLAAFKCFMDVVEYHVPKLARTELVGREGEELFKPYSERTYEERLEIARKVAFLLQGGLHGEGLQRDHRPAGSNTPEEQLELDGSVPAIVDESGDQDAGAIDSQADIRYGFRITESS